MRIAYVTDSIEPGSAQQAADGLRAHGHMVKHVARSPPAQGVRAFAAPVCSDEAAAQSTSVAPTAAALVRHGQQRLPDLVHVATAGPLGWAAVSASRRINSPVSTEFDSTGAAACRAALTPLVNRYLRVFHNRADICFVATEAARDGLAQRGHQRLCLLGGTVGRRGLDAAAMGRVAQVVGLCQRRRPRASSRRAAGKGCARRPRVASLSIGARLPAELPDGANRLAIRRGH